MARASPPGVTSSTLPVRWSRPFAAPGPGRLGGPCFVCRSLSLSQVIYQDPRPRPPAGEDADSSLPCSTHGHNQGSRVAPWVGSHTAGPRRVAALRLHRRLCRAAVGRECVHLLDILGHRHVQLGRISRSRRTFDQGPDRPWHSFAARIYTGQWNTVLRIRSLPPRT